MLDLRKKENLHVVFWLIKDFSWLMGSEVPFFKIVAVAMIFPTLVLAIYLSYKTLKQKDKSDFFHNMAVTCWIVGNSIWMFGEFYCEPLFLCKDNCSKPYAIPFFVIGLLIVLYYYLVQSPHQKKSETKAIKG